MSKNRKNYKKINNQRDLRNLVLLENKFNKYFF